MPPRTRNPGSEWLALSAPNPAEIHREWDADQLAHLPSGRLWLAVETDFLRSVDAMQRIGPDRLGPVLVYASADLAWWLVPCGAEEALADLGRLTVHPAGWMLRCPPADRWITCRGWMEWPDGSGDLTDPAVLGAAFGPGGPMRLSVSAFV
ncbi:hypothetical protein ACFC5Z_05895 [Streptomyces sp. NPDC056004]|uniref:hypothetical protein n=2 Tax=Streptomyces TaxID=1883 RepID=UPI0035E12947